MEDATDCQLDALVNELEIDYPELIEALRDRGELDSLKNAGFVQIAAKQGGVPPSQVKRKFRSWCKLQLDGNLPQPTPRHPSPKEVHEVRNQEAIGDVLSRTILMLHGGFAEEREWLGLRPEGCEPAEAFQAIQRLLQHEVSEVKLADPQFFADRAGKQPHEGGRTVDGIRYLNSPLVGVPSVELQVGALTGSRTDERLYVIAGGRLDRLRQRANLVASRYRLSSFLQHRGRATSADHALKLMLTGSTLDYSPVRIEVWEGLHSRTRYAGTLPDEFNPLPDDVPDWVPEQLGRLDRITLILDPALSGDAVAKLYEEQRRALRPAPNAQMRARQDTEIDSWKHELARFYVEGGYLLDDSDLLEAWEERRELFLVERASCGAKPRSRRGKSAHVEDAQAKSGKFRYAKDLRRVATAAIAHLLDPGRDERA